MDEQQLMEKLHTLNESELFYRNYRLARSSPTGFQEYLDQMDPDTVREKALLIPEWPETIQPEYLETSFFSPDRRIGIHVSKHNCFTPAVTHHHDFFEMFYVLEGRCIHQVKDNHSLLKAGDLCLIQPQVDHSLEVSDESIVIDVLIRRSTFRHYFYSILQGDNLLASFFMSTLYSKQGIDYLIFHTEEDPALRRTLVELCCEFFEKQEYFSVLVNTLVTRIFVLILRRHMASCELPANQMKVTETAIQIVRYLQLNAVSASLGELASELHYTPEYTSRQIKHITGQTFMQLLTSIRMENAEQLLRDTAMPVADIAAAVGYESSEHFIRTFRKHTGFTPSGYRHKQSFTHPVP